jgi:hypothetical protein
MVRAFFLMIANAFEIAPAVHAGILYFWSALAV